MFKNNLKISIRNLLRQKGFSFINMLGLSVGMACCIFISMFIIHELRYDKFNDKYDQIYRVALYGVIDSTELYSSYSCAPLGYAAKDNISEVIESTRFMYRGDLLMRFGVDNFINSHVLYTDSTFFNVFSLNFIHGDANKALSDSGNIVITKKIADKHFSKTNPIGKKLYIGTDSVSYTITGVIENIPSNCHFDVDYLASFYTIAESKTSQWINNNLNTYLVLKENADPREVEKKISILLKKHIEPEFEFIFNNSIKKFEMSGNTYDYLLQPLSNIHFDTKIIQDYKQPIDKQYIYMFIIIAVFIIIIACINFMNIAIARSLGRSKEMCIRKVVGSSKRQLIVQFLFESVVLSFISLFFAFVIVEALFPLFTELTNIENQFEISCNLWYIVGLLVITLSIGLLAGIYPAFLLSSFNPIEILKGRKQKGQHRLLLRKILIITQFSITIAIFLGTFTIHRQLNYMLNKDLGFEEEQLLIIRRIEAITGRIGEFKQKLKKNKNVIACSNSTNVPGIQQNYIGYGIEGDTTSKLQLMWTLWADFDFTDTYKLELADGRFFSTEMLVDSSAVFVNESAVKKLKLKNPLETRLIDYSNNDTIFYIPIIGVVKDFHFFSLHRKIEPAIYKIKPKDWNWGGFISVRIKVKNSTETIESIENLWKEFTNGQPLTYFFLKEMLNQNYKQEQRIGKITAIFSILTIFIACIGLLGLISFTSIQRTKEIGVRKTLGASTLSIVWLFSSEVFTYLLVSVVIASPIAYFIMKKWLNSYAYSINLNFGIFVVMILISLALIGFIVIIFVGYQVIVAARKNPAEAILYE